MVGEAAMPYSSSHNPFNWRERAAEARRIADILTEAIARDHMLSCARAYDQLAELAEKSAASGFSSS
jgi:hypothetical protein